MGGVWEQAEQLAGHLQTALANRVVIDQAVGILRSRTGLSAEEAFDRLRAISQAEDTSLSLMAQRIVDEAVSRVRVCHMGCT